MNGWRGRMARGVAAAALVASACASAPSPPASSVEAIAALQARVLELEQGLAESQVSQLETDEQLDLAKARLTELRRRFELHLDEAGEEAAAHREADFDRAWDDARSERCERAIEGFGRYLDAAPHSELAPWALVERGRCERQLGDWRQALADFERFERDYSESTQLPSARLERARVYRDAGDLDLARRVLEGLLDDFPYSGAAGPAARELGLLRY